MKIKELDGKYIKIGKTSITCVKENGKTCGVVRGVYNMESAPSGGRRFDLASVLRRIPGLWCSDFSHMVFTDGDAVFYINNTRPLNAYKKYFEGREGFEVERENYSRRLQVAEEAAKYITVLNCEILS